MPVKAKYIKDLPLKKVLDGSESLLVQDLNGTQQAPLGTIVDEIKQNSQEKIREIESELAQTNAQLSEIAESGTTMEAVQNKVSEMAQNGTITFNTVTPEMTTFFNVIESPNIFDEQFESGSINSSGNAYDDANYIRTVNFIKVEPNTQYLIYKDDDLAYEVTGYWYDSSKAFISNKRLIPNASTSRINTFNSPSNAQFLKFRTNNKEISHVLIQKGNEFDKYYPYGKVATDVNKKFLPTLNTSELNNDAEYLTQRDLGLNVDELKTSVSYDISNEINFTVINDYFYHKTTGALTQASRAGCAKVSCEPNQKFLVSGTALANVGIVVFLDSSEAFVSSIVGVEGQITDMEVVVPQSAKYMCVSTRYQDTSPINIKLVTTLPFQAAEAMNNIKALTESCDFNTNEENDRLYALEKRIGFKWKEFDTGKVIFMTDDTLSDISTITELLMDTYGFPMSYACISNTLSNSVDANGKGWNTVLEVLKASQDFGGEIWSHSIDSDDLGTNSSTNGGYDIVPHEVAEHRFRTSKKVLRENGLKVNGFVSPRGAFLDNYLEILMKYYRYAYRGSATINPYVCTRINIKQKSLSDLKVDIDNCAKNKSLLILMCHNVVDANGEGYGIYPNGFTLDDFKAVMDYLKWGDDDKKTVQRTDLEVTTMRDVYNQYASI